MVLAIQSILRNSTNFQNFTETIGKKLAGVLAIANRTNQQADNQVTQIITPS